MSALIKQWDNYYILAEGHNTIELEIDEVYVAIRKKDGFLTISAHPLQKGTEDNSLGKIKTKLIGHQVTNLNKKYPTLKRSE